MAHQLKVHPNHRVACMRFQGRINMTDVRDGFLDWVGRPDFDPTFIIIADALKVESVDATFLNILATAQGVHRDLQRFDQSGGMVLAMINSTTVYGMGRMLGQVLDFTSKLRLEIVPGPAEAIQSLGWEDVDLMSMF